MHRFRLEGLDDVALDAGLDQFPHPVLVRFHGDHHRSYVTTPWSTYSFHPLEALMLGNIILLPMLVHDFYFWSLAAVPVLETGAAASPLATVVPASMPAAMEAGGREPPPPVRRRE